MLTQWQICTQNSLNTGFEESIIDILFAATNAAEEMADDVSQTHRFEKAYFDLRHARSVKKGKEMKDGREELKKERTLKGLLAKVFWVNG